jgi:hypothetical protein
MAKDKTPLWFGRITKALSWFFALAALASWFGFIGLFLHYDATRPTFSQAKEGEVYPSNNHGHVVYLSEQDERQLNLLQGAAFCFFVVGFVLDYIRRQQLTVSQINRSVLSACYWLSSPASWLASLRQLSKYNAEPQNRMRNYTKRGDRISFQTTKGISECQKVVRSAEYSAFGVVLERFDGYNFSLSVRRNYRNSFAPLCTGELIPQATGTVVNVQFGMRPAAKIFLAIWCIGIATAGAVILANVLSGSAAHATTGIVVPPVLLGFGILLVHFGKRLGHDEETYILGWLERSFDELTREHPKISS